MPYQDYETHNALNGIEHSTIRYISDWVNLFFPGNHTLAGCFGFNNHNFHNSEAPTTPTASEYYNRILLGQEKAFGITEFYGTYNPIDPSSAQQFSKKQ